MTVVWSVMILRQGMPEKSGFGLRQVMDGHQLILSTDGIGIFHSIFHRISNIGFMLAANLCIKAMMVVKVGKSSVLI